MGPGDALDEFYASLPASDRPELLVELQRRISDAFWRDFIDAFFERRGLRELAVIAAMLSQFANGEDRSPLLAGTLETAIDERFPDDDEWQELVLVLASYRPGGGEFLFDESYVSQRCARMLGRLLLPAT